MFFSLGFLVAALVALAIAPAFWHRAIRLSARRLESQLPLSREEIAATCDLARAESAFELRRLEQIVDSFGEVRAKDKAELGRRTVAVARLEDELAAVRKQGEAREAEIATCRREVAQASAELAVTMSALYDASNRCEQKDAKIFDLRCHLTALHVLSRNQRVAFAAIERDLLQEGEKLVVETVRAARLADELAASRREHGADLEKLAAATAEIARQEQALANVTARATDLNRQCELLAAEAGATERRLREEIVRSRAKNAELLAAREAVEEKMARLGREMAERDQLHAERERVSIDSEDVAMLRKQIIEIGAAVTRIAGAGELAAENDTAAASQPEPAD